MRTLWRWAKRLTILLVTLCLVLLAPVGWVEVACRGEASDDAYQPIMSDAAWHRAESRTLTTYPEWHIVHAYDDYARVISEGDPHDFAFLPAIAGFWTSLCPLKERAAAMGGMTGDSKMTIYTIGVSFTAELLAKALYEETLGRLAVFLRGPDRAPLDNLSAAQAKAYARFLQQTPWYKWDFLSDVAALNAAATAQLRDRERGIALGLEYRAKAAYSKVIAAAVEGIGADELRLRSLVTGLTVVDLKNIEGVQVVGPIGPGIVIESDRYRVFTDLVEQIARRGGSFLEISGNDEILLTAISGRPTEPGALHSFPRQGYGDYRHLILVPVAELADRVRALEGVTLEHVHDY